MLWNEKKKWKCLHQSTDKRWRCQRWRQRRQWWSSASKSSRRDNQTIVCFFFMNVRALFLTVRLDCTRSLTARLPFPIKAQRPQQQTKPRRRRRLTRRVRWISSCVLRSWKRGNKRSEEIEKKTSKNSQPKHRECCEWQRKKQRREKIQLLPRCTSEDIDGAKLTDRRTKEIQRRVSAAR